MINCIFEVTVYFLILVEFWAVGKDLTMMLRMIKMIKVVNTRIFLSLIMLMR